MTLPPGSLPFPRSRNSPFPDGYDIERERAELADMYHLDDVTRDPRFPRFDELQAREKRLKQMQQNAARRSHAEAVVPDAEALRFRSLGRLASDDTDNMQLHTKEGFRLFIGRARDVERKLTPIIGGKRAASAAKSLWYLSGNDNPYADWALIQIARGLDAVRQLVTQGTEILQQRLAALGSRGLVITPMHSTEPIWVELGFRSPYGYQIAALINDYDHYVRAAKSLAAKGLWSDDESRASIRKLTTHIRATFERIVRVERVLLREDLRPLSRIDWLPTADASAKARITAVQAALGEVPAPVFLGQQSPPHTRRRLTLSPAELRLLQQAADAADQASSDAPTIEPRLV